MADMRMTEERGGCGGTSRMKMGTKYHSQFVGGTHITGG